LRSRLCCVNWAHATRSYRCCTSGSNIEQLDDELNFAGDLGLAEEAMEAADHPHDLKSLDGGRRCSHRLKTAGGTDHPFEATVAASMMLFRYFDVRCFVSCGNLLSQVLKIFA
jgi:hypothetical protein